MLNCEHARENGVFNIMKNRLFIMLAAAFFATLSETARPLTPSGIANPAIRRPVGPATVPQSSIRSGLFPSRNPVDTTGNLMITGNVADGRHFQGTVPYDAVSAFAGTTNSTTLDSFLRRSAGTGALGAQPGRYTPYYSPSGTVTTMRPGLRSVIRPPTATIEGKAAEGFAVPTGAREQRLASPEMGIPSIKYRPMRLSPQQLERLISDGVLTHAEAKKLGDEQNVGQTERLQRDIQQLQHRAPTLRQSLIVRDESLRPFSKPERTGDILQPPKLQKLEEEPGKDKQRALVRDKVFAPAKGGLTELRTQGQLDVYERMKQQLENIQKTREQLRTPEKRQEGAGSEDKGVDVKLSDLTRQRQALSTGEEIEAFEAELERQAIGDKQQDELTELELAARAKSIMGAHKTFASYSNDKFNQHIRAAEQYLKEGKYYRAAGTYTLASIYKPDDPLAYAGKSHALFAAGGYMSSSLFLSRALEIFPEYARFKINLVAMVGDRDKLESRIADIKQWLERTGAAELQFLLGYVYYQMGRAGEAKKAIDAAYEKLPDSPAVIALKKAIDSAITENRGQKTEDRKQSTQNR